MITTRECVACGSLPKEDNDGFYYCSNIKCPLNKKCFTPSEWVSMDQLKQGRE